MSKYHFFSITAALICLLLSGCSKKQAEEAQPVVPSVPGTPGAEVTYTAFVQPLFQTKCASCHAAGGEGSPIWHFNGYSSVTSNADRIESAVLVTKLMPLEGSLSPAELQSLKAWFDQGMPQ